MPYLELGSLGGCLYYKDVPLCAFKFINDRFQYSKIKIFDTEDVWKSPVLLDYNKEFYWRQFFEDQITPDTRQNILEDLRRLTPMRYYIPEQLLRWTECRNVQNQYWVICDEDELCWDDTDYAAQKQQHILENRSTRMFFKLTAEPQQLPDFYKA